MAPNQFVVIHPLDDLPDGSSFLQIAEFGA